MARIHYIEPSGISHLVTVPDGHSVMRGAKDRELPGIEADCGGVAACATCHVYVDEMWRQRTGQPTANELEMLEWVTAPGPGSRLSCQILVTELLEGLIVHLPVTQR